MLYCRQLLFEAMPVSKAYVTVGARREDIIQQERYLIPGTGTKRSQSSADRYTDIRVTRPVVF